MRRKCSHRVCRLATEQLLPVQRSHWNCSGCCWWHSVSFGRLLARHTTNASTRLPISMAMALTIARPERHTIFHRTFCHCTNCQRFTSGSWHTLVLVARATHIMCMESGTVYSEQQQQPHNIQHCCTAISACYRCHCRCRCYCHYHCRYVLPLCVLFGVVFCVFIPMYSVYVACSRFQPFSQSQNYGY